MAKDQLSWALCSFALAINPAVETNSPAMRHAVEEMTNWIEAVAEMAAIAQTEKIVAEELQKFSDELDNKRPR